MIHNSKEKPCFGAFSLTLAGLMTVGFIAASPAAAFTSGPEGGQETHYGVEGGGWEESHEAEGSKTYLYYVRADETEVVKYHSSSFHIF